MSNIFLDIETIPSQLPGVLDEFRAAITAPAQYKKPDSIAEWLKENLEAEAEKQWLGTGLDGGLGQIFCICYAVNDSEPVSWCVTDLSLDAERIALQGFFDAFIGCDARTRWIGHNLIGFDLKFLWHRAMVLGIRPGFPLPRDPKPWDGSVYDTMIAWSGVRDRVSLDRLCKYFGIEGKGEMDGSKVWPMVKEGKRDEVVEYCRGDVKRVRAVFNRMTFASA